MQIRAGGGAGGGEVAEEGERVFVFAAALGRFASIGRKQRGTEIGDEQRGLRKRREVFEAAHEAVAREKRRGGRFRRGGVPVIKAVVGLTIEEAREQARGRGGESGIIARGELGMRGGLRFEFRETERDGFFDLIREIEILPGDGREERVDKMKPAKIVAGGRWH